MPNDHDLLVQIASDVRDLKRTIDGNGRPGISDRLVALETVVAERTAPSKSAVLGLSGAATIAVSMLIQYVQSKFGGN